MAKVNFVKSARKEYKDSFTGEAIKVGESYYWWSFRYQPRQISKTPPKQSQLTQSEFLQAVYGIQEKIEGMVANETIVDQLNDVKNEIESLRDETEGRLSEMADKPQNGSVVELLQSRVDSLQEWYDSFDDIGTDINSALSQKDKEQMYKIILEKIRAQSYTGE